MRKCLILPNKQRSAYSSCIAHHFFLLKRIPLQSVAKLWEHLAHVFPSHRSKFHCYFTRRKEWC